MGCVKATRTREEVFVVHGNAPLTPKGRLDMVRRVKGGCSKSRVAREMGVSRGYVRKWVGRFDAEGEASLVDRSSRPHTSPGRCNPVVEQRVVDARRRLRAGPNCGRYRGGGEDGYPHPAAEGGSPVAGLRPFDRGAQTTGGAGFGDTV